MKEIITLEELKEALKWCWSAGTSYDKDNWTPKNPACGQCAVTALLVKKYLGGNIVAGFIKGVGWHFWNQLPGNLIELDLTNSQFEVEPIFLSGEIVEDKDGDIEKYLMSNSGTRERSELLESRVEEYFRLKGEKK